ncbi:MAG: 50S ribosomal protein L4 [Candidatus Omnitrophota bacterium]|nr:50S ribosomal protein L4 [Candidatus Omnitrophota bacterium]
MVKAKKVKKEKKIENSEMPEIDVYSLSGKKVEKFKLDPDVFNVKVNKPLLHEIIMMYRANARQGNASTKTKGLVRGGGKKPWRQKGTGRARSGSIRSPLWRHGGTIFGPLPRDFGYDMPKKTKRIALISSLSAKLKDNEILVIEKDPDMKQPKTSEIAKILSSLKSYKSRVLFLYANNNESVIKSCNNIRNLTIKRCSDFNTYDVLSNSKILFSKDTHDAIVKRLKQ